jgi:ribosomal protein S27E
MSDAIRFACPECGEKLKIAATHAGRAVKCPKCGGSLTVPEEEPVLLVSPTPVPASTTARDASVIYCVACGTKNSENNFRCVQCGAVLHESSAPAARVEDPLLSLVPYKNASAVWAYYLGVFSLIPCFGVFLAIAAIVMGFLGLGNASKHPEAKGKVHAWVGILLGILVLCGHVAAIVLIAVLSNNH